MPNSYIQIEQSQHLKGEAQLVGAKNAVLVAMASLLLTDGKSVLKNVPCSADVLCMIELLQQLGADIQFNKDEHVLSIDTSAVTKWTVSPSIMKQMRASILVMGPLLARFGRANIALPGGCVIGARPINYHLLNFQKMGVAIDIDNDFINAHVDAFVPTKLVLEYPSVGATENLIMAAVLAQGTTRIVHASLEPEVLDLIVVLKKMGAHIQIIPPATVEIEGVSVLKPIEHEVMFDRLEAGSLLLATAITGGEIYLPQAPAYMLDMFLMKLQEMGHDIEIGPHETGIRLKATGSPKAVSFKTGPYPGFPTDLQAPMMALQCIAEGISSIEETVFENRLLHVRELQKMGAQITVKHNKALVTGVEELYGTHVIAADIRASCALVIAGLAAKGSTIVSGIQHWRRGYEKLEEKLAVLGAEIMLKTDQHGDVLAYQADKAVPELQP